jgi:predicted TPR repeat methyltransferase
MNLGTALGKLGNAKEAIEAFGRAVAGIPQSVEAHVSLGRALLESGRVAEAIDSAQKAMRLRPTFSEAQSLCAVARAATGDIEGGVALLRDSLSPQVPLSRAFVILGAKLMQLTLFEQARRCLEQALRAEPQDVMARHLLAAVSGENPAHPVDGYVRQLFEASAAGFDKHLVCELEYRIPQEMVEALLAVDGGRSKPWDVLDLGCGTGMVGQEIASHARSLVGIDLATNMLERSRERNIYTELRCADLLRVLDDEQNDRYDVITAADVFIYVGKLDDLIRTVRRVLRTNGLFAFSVETPKDMIAVDRASDTPGYHLGRMGRYSHGMEYIRSLAARNRFEIKLLSRTRIRHENRRPVAGLLTVWRAAEFVG